MVKKCKSERLADNVMRLSGQLTGIANMLMQDRACEEVIVQIMAAQGALRSLGLAVLKDHLTHCVKDAMLSGDSTALDRFAKTLDIFV